MRVYPEDTQDKEFEKLGEEGFKGTLNDRQYDFFELLGYDGALPDKFKAWKDDGMPYPEPEPEPEEPVDE